VRKGDSRTNACSATSTSDALLERDSVIEDLRIERTLVHGTMMKT
jgi:hypothetical protein